MHATSVRGGAVSVLVSSLAVHSTRKLDDGEAPNIAPDCRERLLLLLFGICGSAGHRLI